MKKKFKGDIIITDPCYMIEGDKDWDKCNYGQNMEALGFTNYLSSETYYGDWSCTVSKIEFYDLIDSDYEEEIMFDIKDEIGEFCADAGMVGVFLLDEVLKYNPEFNYHIEKPWTTALIKDFDGYISFETTEVWDGDYYKELKILGLGNINFISYQTGY